MHDNENTACPWNDPETFCNPATAGMPCSCVGPPKPSREQRLEAALREIQQLAHDNNLGALFDIEHKCREALREES